jgi:probable selenium-dependent hydroxylase accessory protein YqeC
MTALIDALEARKGIVCAVGAGGKKSVLYQLALASGSSGSFAYACPSTKPGRHAGVSATTIRSIHEDGRFDATYVKADGARMRWLKAPAEGEPVLIPEADIVIPVVSARAIGEPLSERVAHRLEQVRAVTGLAPGSTLTPEAVGRLLASEDGGLKGSGAARVAPVINMVDNISQQQMALAAARAALALTPRIDRVVLSCLRGSSVPVVAVVTR